LGAQPLTGVRVLDASWVWAGPTCTRILADMGADVITVENIQRLDVTRIWFPAENEMDEFWNRGGYCMKRHMSKRGITLNLSHPRGAEVFKRLAQWADVVVESFSPRVMKQFGLDYPVLRQTKRDLIMISLSGFGQKGPRADWTAYGMGIDALSGIAANTGYEGGPPIRTGVSYTDPIAGTFGAAAVLLALVHKRRTGEGTYVDLSQLEAAVEVIGETLMEFAMNKRVAPRIGNRHPSMAPHGVYRCQGEDAWVAIAVGTDEQWDRLCKAMGEPPWCREHRFSDLRSRWLNQDELDRLLETWTSTRDRFETARLLQAARVPAAPVLNNKDLVFDEHLRARRFFHVMNHPVVGERLYPVQAAGLFNGERVHARRRAPLLGEHSRGVLRSIAGLSEEEIDALEAERVTGDQPAFILDGITTDQLKPMLQLPLDSLLKVGAITRLDADYRDKQLAGGKRRARNMRQPRRQRGASSITPTSVLAP